MAWRQTVRGARLCNMLLLTNILHVLASEMRFLTLRVVYTEAREAGSRWPVGGGGRLKRSCYYFRAARARGGACGVAQHGIGGISSAVAAVALR